MTMGVEDGRVEKSGYIPSPTAIEEYKSARLITPDLVDKTWQTLWKVWGERIGHTFDVPTCDRTTEELETLKKEGRGVLLVPDEVYTPEGLVRLGLIFPLMRSRTLRSEQAARISYGSTKGGCIDIEMNLDAPYATCYGYNRQELNDRITADGRKGQRLPTYIIGGQFSKLLTQHYFDEDTVSRLTDLLFDGRILDAYAFFRHSDGDLCVSAINHEYRNPNLRGRSEGVKRLMIS